MPTLFQQCAAEFGGSLDATGLLDFVDAGHDLFLAIDQDSSDELRELAADLGVDFDTKGSVITDHFNRHDQQQSAIVTSNALESKIVFGYSHKQVRFLWYALSLLDASGHHDCDVYHALRCLQAPVVYRGIGASISPKSTLVSPLAGRLLPWGSCMPCLVQQCAHSITFCVDLSQILTTAAGRQGSDCC